MSQSWHRVFVKLRLPRRLVKDAAGSTLLEVALSLPLLLMVFTGIFAFAIAYNNEIVLTQGVGAGGEYLQLIRTSTSDPCADTLTAIKNAAPNLTGSNITMTITMNGVAESGTSCSGAQSNLVAGVPVTVKATYPCKLPVYAIAFPSCTLTAQVTEYEY